MTLAIYGPVVAAMLVYNDFYSNRGGVSSYATGDYVVPPKLLDWGLGEKNSRLPDWEELPDYALARIDTPCWKLTFPPKKPGAGHRAKVL